MLTKQDSANILWHLIEAAIGLRCFLENFCVHLIEYQPLALCQHCFSHHLQDTGQASE